MNYTLEAKRDYQNKVRELNNNWLPYKNRDAKKHLWGLFINSVKFQLIDNKDYKENLINYLDKNIKNIPLNVYNKSRMLYTIKEEYIKDFSIKILPKYIIIDFLEVYF